jgi:hypothetical protein
VLQVAKDDPAGARGGWADRLALALHHRPFVVIGLVLLVYSAGVAVQCALRPISFDEWFTYEEARFPTLGRLMQALGEGPEQAPPLHFLLTRLSLGVLGDGAWGLRFPAIFGIGLALACLYLIVARRFGPPYGLGAVAVALNGPAWFYATDSRPYALMLAFCALAVFCWQRTEPGTRRGPALVGLTLSAAAAVSSHYYATIALIPLGIGQLVRSWRRRRVDAPVWAALALGGAVVFLYLPLILPKRRFVGSFMLRPAWSMLPDLYEFFAIGFAIPLALLFVGWCAGSGAPRRRAEDPTESAEATMGFLPEERAVALGYVLLPVIALVLAKTVIGVLVDRYLITTVLGFAILVPEGVARLARGRAGAGLALVIVLGCWFGLAQGGKLLQWWKYPAQAPRSADGALFAEMTQGDEPVLITNMGVYFDAFHLWPRELVARLVNFDDRPATSFVELRLLQPLLPGVRVEGIRTFSEARKPVLVLATEGEPSRGPMDALVGSGAEVRLIASRGAHRLYRATWPDGEN